MILEFMTEKKAEIKQKIYERGYEEQKRCCIIQAGSSLKKGKKIKGDIS